MIRGSTETSDIPSNLLLVTPGFDHPRLQLLLGVSGNVDALFPEETLLQLVEGEVHGVFNLIC